MRYGILGALVTAALSACATVDQQAAKPTVATGTVEAGTSVSRKGEKLALAKGHLALNEPVPGAILLDAQFKPVSFKPDGKVKVVSIVPSIDTRVCELQTHELGESKGLDPRIERITLSRDLPVAQKRFAMESNLENITYLSDFKDGSFGRASGLLIEENGLLARGVMVVDGEGRVRYLQIVPDITTLPDMKKAFAAANALLAKP